MLNTHEEWEVATASAREPVITAEMERDWAEAKESPAELREYMGVVFEELAEVQRAESLTQFFEPAPLMDVSAIRGPSIQTGKRCHFDLSGTASDLFEAMVSQIVYSMDAHITRLFDGSETVASVYHGKFASGTFLAAYNRAKFAPAHLALGKSAWEDFYREDDLNGLAGYFDPVCRYQQVLRGDLGSIVSIVRPQEESARFTTVYEDPPSLPNGVQLQKNVHVFTDGVRQSHGNVIRPGAFYLLPTAAELGKATPAIIQIEDMDAHNLVLRVTQAAAIYSTKQVIVGTCMHDDNA